MYRVVAFNAKTSSAGLQGVLEQPLEKRPPKSWGPPQPKKLIFFLDDINMPEPDKYGTQESIALLRQMYDCGFWYDRSGKEGKATAKLIVDVRFVSAMNPKSGTFTILDRLLRCFGVFAAIMPEKEDLCTIYGQIMKDYFQKFQSEVIQIIDKVVLATVSLHEQITSKFLPTAAKFFYQWNMREMMNIFQGVCKCVPSLHNKASSLVYVWMHECFRTFRDRMPDEDDIRKFDEIFANVLETVKDSNAQVTLEEVGLWAPFGTTKEGGEGLYDQITIAKAQNVLNTKLQAFNNYVQRMELVLFDQAIEHVCRICRITCSPRGNGLLVGVGGSGKQSLARLASYCNDLEILQIVVTSNYNINDFRTTIQDVYKKAAIKDVKMSFILTDSQIVDENMLMYLNDMLNSGIIPDLFTEDERKEQIGNITNIVKSTGNPDYGVEDVCWSFYINRVRANVHLILCFSPVGQQFPTWCRRFPALANTTVIDWFHPWPQQALISVAQRFLEDANLGSSTMIDACAEFMSECHEGIGRQAEDYFRQEKRRCYTTPKSFLELIALYKTLLAQKRNDLDVAQRRLASGIDRIKEAAEQVAALQTVLKKEGIEVDEAAEKTRILMETVSKERKIVEEQNVGASQEEARTNAIVIEVEAIAADCARDLAAAKPLVDEALGALNTLDKTSLTELKSLAKPPDDVCLVTAAVMVLTANPSKIPPVRNRDWGNSKKMMANVGGWMNELKAFNIDNIPEACIENIQMYISNPGFEPSAVFSKSQAAAGLCKWVLGMNAYYKVRCELKPKEEKLAESQARLDQSKTALKKVQDRVADLKAKLDGLVRSFDDAMDKKKEIEAKAKKTKDKAALAERLVGGLADENVRWGKTIKELTEKAQLLVGDVLAAAAFVSYIGPFSKVFRERIVGETWLPEIVRRGIPTTPGVDIVMDILTNEAAVASWNNEGLPSDRISTENAALVTNCTRWPLLIDPQLQGVKWIRTREEKNGLKIVQPGGKDWLKTLKDCMENGLPILIEACGENLEPILDNVLARATYKKGSKMMMKIGGAEVEYNDHFRLILQTKLSNPSYKPEANAQTTLINFMVTEVGLEDQLLAVVVNQERPDLEVKRVALIREMNTMTIELQKCEDGLLFELSNATGDILENVTLIENLEATKKKSREINKAMAIAKDTQKTIAESRLYYTVVAVRGSLLFFQIDNLCKIDHMYQYSLEAFMVVFNKALGKAEQPADPKDVKQRVENVLGSITQTVYAYVARGLFERHKLIFSSLLCFAVFSRAGEIDRKQLNFLLRGPKKKGIDPPEAVSQWCPMSNWESVLALSEIDGTSPSFDILPGEMAETNRWRQWAETEKPEEEKMPTDWKNLSDFQRLLVLRCLRPDRLTSALENFVGAKLGRFFVADQAVDLTVTFQDAGPTTPIFFILSPGVDPVGKVETMAKKHGNTYDNDKLHNVSLGQGQEKVAEDRMARCFENGGWVMLNNIHLVKKWLLVLEKRLEEYAEIYTRMAQIAKRKAEKRMAKRRAREAAEAEAREAAGETEPVPGEEGGVPPAEDGAPPAEGDAPPPAEGGTEGAPATDAAPAEGEATETAAPVEEEEEDDDDDPEMQIKGPIGNIGFRVFLAAEPSDVIPIGILQRSIKLTNEPPSGIQANVLRAMTNFSDEPWEESAKPSEYRCVMFAMCFFHAVIIERKKFGPQGWNRVYPFNIGDLTTCLSVFKNFEERPKVPWEDLRYVFGEIMYGGHITDDWDRVLCSAYLQMFIVPEVCEGMDLATGFAVPPPGTYQEYVTYVKENMPPESPLLYGLHANAEINFRTTQAEVLFKTVNLLQPKSASSSEGMTPTDQVRMRLDEMMQSIPEMFNMAELSERLEDERSPQQHVFYQECERINALVEVMKRTLIELDLGLKGALSMTSLMQLLFDQIYNEKIPDAWANVSFMSMRPLSSWFDNLQKRNQQLLDWIPEITTPKVTMISYFFNPMSFLTAIMQYTALTNTFDLDQMALISDVLKKSPEQVDTVARDGAYIAGLVLEGGRWDSQTQSIEESRMKELYPKVPVINIRSLPLGKIDRKDQYECPMYKTQARGPGFVVALWLKSKHPPRRWVVAGVGLVLDVVEV
jgi:dynein heavy chain